jgi:heme A synthase
VERRTVSNGAVALGVLTVQPSDALASQVQTALGGEQAVEGLASLDVDFPPPDASRWASFAFRAPRAAELIAARSVQEDWIAAGRRLGLVALLLAGLFALRVLFTRRPRDPRATLRWSGILLTAALFGLLFGVLPIASLVLLVVALVQRRRCRRALASA